MISTVDTVVNTQCTSLLVHEYPANYKIFYTDQVKVYYIDTEEDETLLVETTEYSISAITDSGFMVTLVGSYDEGTLSVRRIIEKVQEVDFIEGGDFPADVFEYALDKLTMLIQQTENNITGDTGQPGSGSPLLANVERFNDSSYVYFLGDVGSSWQVNRWDIYAVRTTSAGSIDKPTTLVDLQALSYT